MAATSSSWSVVGAGGGCGWEGSGGELRDGISASWRTNGLVWGFVPLLKQTARGVCVGKLPPRLASCFFAWPTTARRIAFEGANVWGGRGWGSCQLGPPVKGLVCPTPRWTRAYPFGQGLCFKALFTLPSPLAPTPSLNKIWPPTVLSLHPFFSLPCRQAGNPPHPPPKASLPPLPMQGPPTPPPWPPWPVLARVGESLLRPLNHNNTRTDLTPSFPTLTPTTTTHS